MSAATHSFDLSRFDDTFSPVPAAPPRASRIFNGLYSVTFPDGSHRTFKIHTKQLTAKFAAGKRIISLLVGPDNEHDYEPFGFVDDSGISVWRRLRGGNKPSKYEVFAELVWKLATDEEVQGYDLAISRTCLICSRTLTDPESIAFGIGPTCRERWAAQ